MIIFDLNMPTILSIGGSDCSSAAGIQMDIKTAMMLNSYCITVLTVVTAQNTYKVSGIQPLNPEIIDAQLNTLIDDFKIDAVKVGMLYTKGTIEIVHGSLDRLSVPIVVDPILVSSTGTRLLEDDATDHYIRYIVRRSSVVTPNILEAEWLSGMHIDGVEAAEEAAVRIAREMGCSVIIKGGHLRDDPIDILFHDGRVHRLHGKRQAGEVRGLGSIFSAALTVGLAKGLDIPTASKIAKSISYNALTNSVVMGKGMRIPILKEDLDDPIVIELSKTIDLLTCMEPLGLLIPESQSNFVYAREDATSREDVAGVEGRIVKAGDRAFRAGRIVYGVSRHVADALLTAMRYDKSIRAAMNIMHSDDIISACSRLGMSIASYDRNVEPKDIKVKEGSSIRWGIDYAVRSYGSIPDIVYHRGDIGKEPMIVVFGKEPRDVAYKVKRILREIGSLRSEE